jgi:hypothetical protein
LTVGPFLDKIVGKAAEKQTQMDQAIKINENGRFGF